MFEPLPTIPYGKTPTVFLLGSGLMQTFDGDSWDRLLTRITTVPLSETQKKSVQRLPYSMQPVVLTGDNVGPQLKKRAQEALQEPTNMDAVDLIRSFCDLKPDVILTTNYTYEIEKALDESFFIKAGRTHKYRKKAVDEKPDIKNARLYQYFSLPSGKEKQNIWHIHGEMAKPDTMVLGHYYYCELVSLIRQHIPRFIRRYQYSQTNKKDFVPESWVDYFMMGNVYTIGFGMGLSEMDIWWLVNCKKRNGSGKLYFWDGNIAEEKRLLAEAYGVETRNAHVEKGHYLAFYKALHKDLSEQLGK